MVDISYFIIVCVRLILPLAGSHHADHDRWGLWRNAKELAKKVHDSMTDKRVQHWHGPRDSGDWISASVSAPVADPTSPKISLARLHLYVVDAAVVTTSDSLVMPRDIDSIVIDNRTINCASSQDINAMNWYSNRVRSVCLRCRYDVADIRVHMWERFWIAPFIFNKAELWKDGIV